MASKKPIVFKSSKLSTAADQLWSASKNEFKPADTSNSIKLDLGKTLTNDKSGGTKPNSDLASSKGFVFGFKLTERVTFDGKALEKSETENGTKKEPISCDDDNAAPKPVSAVFEEIQKKGTTSSFLAADKNQYEDESASTSSTKLKESADEAETRRESATTKSKSSEHVDVSTGEENEVNVHHAMCKLHSFDINTKSWHERGMSSVRINRIDEEPTAQYRIVGRSMGNQRVVLNSRLFNGMVLEKVSAKRIKFSATTPESELPVLFLTTASEFVTEQLFSKLSEIVKPKMEEEQSRKRKASSEIAAGDMDATSAKTDASKKSAS